VTLTIEKYRQREKSFDVFFLLKKRIKSISNTLKIIKQYQELKTESYPIMLWNINNQIKNKHLFT